MTVSTGPEPVMWKRRHGGAATIVPENRSKEELIAGAEAALLRKNVARARSLADSAERLEGAQEDHPRLLLVQARIARQEGKNQDAAALAAQLANLAKGDVRAAFALGELANDINAKVEALGWLENALKLEPSHEPSVLLATRILRQLDKQDRAYQLLEQARASEPPSIPVCLTLGEMLQEDGRFDDAAGVYREVLDLHPGNAAAISGLLTTRRADREDDLLARAQMAAESIDTPLPQRVGLNYALAKAFDRREDYAQAFQHAAAANELLRRHHPHDAEEEQSRSQRLMESLRQFEEIELSVEKDNPVRPLFIVGMPRSGTTLVEQILSGHPQIFGLGELPFWPNLVGRWNLSNPGFVMPDVDKAIGAAQRYRDLLQARGVTDGFAIDKLPDNYRFVSLISALLPDAIFIHCVRDPRDNLVSIFFEHFAPSQTYTTGMESIVERRRDHDAVTAEWQRLYSDRMFRLDYETLVREGEPAIRGLVQRLGLPWDDRVMDYRERERTVRTPSRQQVREPLYDRSIGRWMHYQDWMGTAFDAFSG